MEADDPDEQQVMTPEESAAAAEKVREMMQNITERHRDPLIETFRRAGIELDPETVRPSARCAPKSSLTGSSRRTRPNFRQFFGNRESVTLTGRPVPAVARTCSQF